MPRIGWFGLIYLALLPLTVFSGEPWWFLLLSFVLGFQLFALFERPSLGKTLFFFLILILSFTILKPRLGLDTGLLNAINTQRGEHPGFQTSLVAKLLHNKTELGHSFVANLDRLMSPVAIFASGFWHKIDPYYPLGYLFPWDLYFIYRSFRFGKRNLVDKSFSFFVLAAVTLVLLAGLIYLDQALLFSYAIIYFLALLSLSGFRTCTKSVRLTFLAANLVFLLYQINITAYFKL